jgi:hypothetical protein
VNPRVDENGLLDLVKEFGVKPYCNHCNSRMSKLSRGKLKKPQSGKRQPARPATKRKYTFDDDE